MVMKSAIFRSGKYLVGLASIVGGILLWQHVSSSRIINPVLLPPPSAIAPELMKLFATGAVWSPLFHTLSLLAVGFSIAAVSGVALGLLMATYRPVYLLLEPIVEAIRPIPKAALIAPLFLLLGIGYSSMLVITVLAQFFPILINTVQGASGTDRVTLDTGRTFRLRAHHKLWKIILPSALPMIFAGLRVAIAIGLVMAIIAEMLAGNSGIGFYILDYERSFDTVKMFAWIIVLVGVGLIISYTFDFIEIKCVPWRSR